MEPSSPFHFSESGLYRLVEYRTQLQWLSIVLDVRAWARMERYDPNRVEYLDLAQALGYGYKAPGEASAAPPPPRHPRAKLRFFAEPPSALSKPQTSPTLSALPSTHSQTIKTLRIAVVHDEESIGTGVFQPFDEDESDEDNPWVFYKFDPPSPKPQANADLPSSSPILLPRLECFHLEAGSLDYDNFRCLQMPKVTTLVLGIDADWTNDQNKLSEMPKPLSNLKHGQMGPFQKKGTALRAWEALVGRHNKAWALFEDLPRPQGSSGHGGKGPGFRGGGPNYQGGSADYYRGESTSRGGAGPAIVEGVRAIRAAGGTIKGAARTTRAAEGVIMAGVCVTRKVDPATMAGDRITREAGRVHTKEGVADDLLATNRAVPGSQRGTEGNWREKGFAYLTHAFKFARTVLKVVMSTGWLLE
ncbi:hypothetical protein CF319_g5047 [Tilletia indica]|nr:hypothetical protein CF319_g5047 [Tilletia indica]KAE8227906.1 hypothetical protein CF326_g7181 [Tilletia indica]